MGDVVKATRRYDSSHRREQAESTRAQILRSAQRRFESDGYVSTTVAAIARDAGVAVKTVYLAFETKSGLLRALWGVLLRGERDVPVASLETYQRVLREPDPAAQLRLNAANARATKERIGSILRVIESAAAQDEEMAAFWQHIETDFRAEVYQRADGAATWKSGAGSPLPPTRSLGTPRPSHSTSAPSTPMTRSRFAERRTR